MSFVRRIGGPVNAAGRTVFTVRRYQFGVFAMFLVSLLVYAVTLPATYTGGQIGVVSLRFLTPALAGFAMILAGLVSVAGTFTAYAIRVGATAGTKSAAGGVIGSFLTPLVCCSPVLPALAAGIAAVTGLSPLFAGTIQGLIASYEIHILTGATLGLTYSVHATARSITTDGCDVSLQNGS